MGANPLQRKCSSRDVVVQQVSRGSVPSAICSLRQVHAIQHTVGTVPMQNSAVLLLISWKAHRA